MTPQTATVLADVILLLHVVIVLFVIVVPPLVWIGAARAWAWVRNLPLRLLHLATIGFVVVQSWLGQYCPLTVWESDLRRLAGGAGYQRGLIEDWLGSLLFFNAPAWVFIVVYSLFGALVLWTWWRWPPRRASVNED